MAENKLKQSTTAAPKRQSKPRKQPAFMNGLNMSAFYLFNNIHFIFYLAFLGVIYIANSHYAVQTIKEIKAIQKDLRSISWESNSKKSDLMYQSMESIVAKKVKKMGLEELETNPKKIINKDKRNR
ncbi:FtsL-like putative cell division protein [Aureispira anguillae]|uniref:FtsL-like putative cell division protein n=1 Tax=Aureispira anguillae TaxID=2864201 RepID=A0A915YH58_9BACT|nr:FtsL-like putative cell division protein [Aureispira anguillae]BDS12858.1 FtsL-like putative cell division protein [Aureispira anguillae]